MGPAVGSEVWIERRKWPDTPHYGVQGTVLGEDDHGVWAGAGPGHRVTKGADGEFVGQYPIVWCVPHHDWFLAHYLVGHPNLDVYIDICTPAVWSDRGARTVDLDFDVVVWNATRQGRIELVDEDEFEDHSVTLAYPAELVTGARRAAADVLARVQAGDPPFTMATAEPWLARLPAGSAP